MTKLKQEAGTAESRLIEVTLVKPHTHKRQRLAEGSTLKVTAAQKAWLEGQGVIGEPPKAGPDE